MEDKTISQLTELTLADPLTDVLPLVDSDLNQTKKMELANLPLSDYLIIMGSPEILQGKVHSSFYRGLFQSVIS